MGRNGGSGADWGCAQVQGSGSGSATWVELIAIAVKDTDLRCRQLDGGEVVTPRPAGGVRNEAEGNPDGLVPLVRGSVGC